MTDFAGGFIMVGLAALGLMLENGLLAIAKALREAKR